MKYLLVVILIFSTTFASAETYKWEDKNGMHFTDNPSNVPQKYRDKAIAEAKGTAERKTETSSRDLQENRMQQVRDNGVYVGQMKEVTKSRQPPCSPAQDVRVTVENGVVIMPPFLLGGGQNTKITAPIESDGTFIGKLPGAEMRGKIVGTALDAKIIVPRRCVYDITATKN